MIRFKMFNIDFECDNPEEAAALIVGMSKRLPLKTHMTSTPVTVNTNSSVRLNAINSKDDLQNLINLLQSLAGHEVNSLVLSNTLGTQNAHGIGPRIRAIKRIGVLHGVDINMMNSLISNKYVCKTGGSVWKIADADTLKNIAEKLSR